jgi:hypothetical protein
MPTDIKIGLLTIGAVFVLAAALPRRFKLFGKETPNTAGKLLRVGVGFFGVVLIVGALVMRDTTKKIEPTSVSATPATVVQPATDLLQLATVALYSCRAPSDPSAPPDGGSASKDQMIASQRETSKFNDDMNQYLDCLKVTSANLETQYRGVAPAGELSAVEALYVRLNNGAVDRLQAKAKAFNDELHKYKARSPQ